MNALGSRIFGVMALLALCACDPVTPEVNVDTRTFEGFTVHSAIPENPVGLVYVFHGSQGSADFALKIETLDQTNELLARGYGWVATESTERTGDKRWFVFDSSLATNPDLARLVRLHADLVATTSVTADTPMFGIGMSNGARMVTLFGQAFSDAGYPLVAVAPFNGRAAPSVNAAGGLTVPGFWVASVNDTVVPPGDVIAAQQDSAAQGVVTQLFNKPEEPLLPIRFTRIPAVDLDEAVLIYEALKGTGAWDADGNRQLDFESTLQRIGELTLPQGTGATNGQVRNQIQALLAMHQFVGFYRVSLADFFDARLLEHNSGVR